MKIVDLQLNLDGVLLRDGESVESLISKIEALVNSNYDVTYDVLSEEDFDE